MSNIEEGIFHRTRLLVGSSVMDVLSSARVIIFGVGGVGSWCAESLVRSGIRHLTIVDSDRVCITNVNRQLMATTSTVGQVKVEALRERLLSINPEAEIEALMKIYCEETADDFDLASYDYIIDAIDSLKDKVLLIRRATDTKSVFFSSPCAFGRVSISQLLSTTALGTSSSLNTQRNFRRGRRFDCLNLRRNAAASGQPFTFQNSATEIFVGSIFRAAPIEEKKTDFGVLRIRGQVKALLPATGKENRSAPLLEYFPSSRKHI